MHKIDTNTATANGEFTDGDSSAAIDATDLNAAWFNTIQRELINLVQGTGQTLSSVDDSQIFKAVKKLGFQAFQVDNGTFDSAANNAGNIAIVCEPVNLTITGTMQTGKVVFIIPLWEESSANSIRVNYNNDHITIAKGNALFGFVSNGSFVYENELVGFQFPIVVGGKIFTSNIKTNSIEFEKEIGPGVIEWELEDGNVDTEASSKWRYSKYWSLGQVKKFCLPNGSSVKQMAVINKDGATYMLDVKQNRFYEFVCVGFWTNEDGIEYACLLAEG